MPTKLGKPELVFWLTVLTRFGSSNIMLVQAPSPSPVLAFGAEGDGRGDVACTSLMGWLTLGDRLESPGSSAEESSDEFEVGCIDDFRSILVYSIT